MAGQIQEPIDFGYRDLFGSFGDLHDLVARADLAFLNDTEIESGPLMGNEQAGHLRVEHANADSITSDSWLRHLEQRAADPVTIADADLVVCQTFDGQVF